MGWGNLVVKVTDSWVTYHEFEPSTAEDPSCRKGQRVLNTSRGSSVLKLAGVEVLQRRWLECWPRHLIMVQTDEVRHQKASCI
ncbi:hypothetical protein TNCV_2860031 [Trichonephila clavipes]|nr:hypothetical protein TNCV_2860031 [Trichonephila clavipes]